MTVQKQRTQLLKQIQKHLKAVHVFVPGMEAAPEAIDSSLQPEQATIYLPSSIPENHRQNFCIPGLPEIEERLRYAQAMEALSALRQHL